MESTSSSRYTHDTKLVWLTRTQLFGYIYGMQRENQSLLVSFL